MRLSRIYPVADAAPESLDLDARSSRSTVIEWYRPPTGRWLRINLIASVSGNAEGSDGTSETLSNPADRRILGVIRELADIVLIGAQSLRAEGYVLPRRSRLAVLTVSGDLSGHRFERGADAEAVAGAAMAGRVVVVCAAASVDRVRETIGEFDVDIIVVPSSAVIDGRLSLPVVVGLLRERGFESIVCEGGPSLAGQLISEDLVDEVCLSTAPLVNGALLPPFGSSFAGERPLELTQLLVDDSSGLYARWSLGR